jgi:DNA-binding MarR family transcriptional regulator
MANKVNTIDPSRESELNAALELMHFSYRAFTAGPDRILEGRGLQRVHHRILYFVGRHQGISVHGLLSILAVSKQALNAPLRQLQQMRLVDSRPAKEDRRVRELALTADGSRLETSLSGLQRREMERVFRSAGEEAEHHWREVMAKIAGSGSVPEGIQRNAK